MININGKDWVKLESSDIQSVLSEPDFCESFYFEFKDDRVTNKKLIKEVSAFANTFGGYIFLGISDSKKIDGCEVWNEQKIHTTIHDSITPTPSFDVKKFTLNSKVVYVVKIDEGIEPPYITSDGKIYERLSSGSFIINDSSKLSQIYNKKENLLAEMERKISIPQVYKDINNIYGYIDIGFCLVSSDIQVAFNTFTNVDLKLVVKEILYQNTSFNLSRIGDSIVFTPGGLTTQNGFLSAHTNNFIEIMADGSARMRILLINNNQYDLKVNMVIPMAILQSFKKMYTKIMGGLFPNKIVYAKKYELLTVKKQFEPILFYDEDLLELRPDLKKDNERYHKALQQQRQTFGIKTVITDNRIPKTGLYTIDRNLIEMSGLKYTTTNIIDKLFYSKFVLLGNVEISNQIGGKEIISE